MTKFGSIFSLIDNIILAKDLEGSFVGEVIHVGSLNNPTGQALVMNVDTYDYYKLLLIKGSTVLISANQKLFRTRKHISVDIGWRLLGLIINPFGEVIHDFDVNFKSFVQEELLFESRKEILTAKAPSIIERCPIRKPLLTGITLVDIFLPIGYGQRELILGDNNVGKTTLAVTFIINQRRIHDGYTKVWRTFESNLKGSHFRSFDFSPCIFVSIGKRRAEVIRVKNILNKFGALYFTCLVYTSSDEFAAVQYLAPYTGCTIGEWFRDLGYNSIIVYDDLSAHAVAYRQISLLLRRPPGREAYPGDIFYIHSTLLERAGLLWKNLGGGSLTAFPIVETKLGDISGYIPTNIISITDGQIHLDMKLKHKGQTPAIDLTKSVSRIGSNAQFRILKGISKKVLRDYTLYKYYEGFTKVSSDLDSAITKHVTRGLQLFTLLKSDIYVTKSLTQEVFGLFALTNGFLEGVEQYNINAYFEILFSDDLSHSFLKKNPKLVFYITEPTYIESFLRISPLSVFENDLTTLFKSYHAFFLSEVQPTLFSTFWRKLSIFKKK
jgi:F-type H+-transporting ATPase subunit alpha